MCKKEFYPRPDLIKRGDGNYCSKNCFHIGEKGKIPWNKGITGLQTHSLETRKKISISHKGDKNKNCNNGSSIEPYTVDWTLTFKRSIRERDKYTCHVCGREPAVDCHHIDYNKKNCSLDNLITLCRPCHMKTNHNRKYWVDYFIKEITKRND
mgnify:CR=1 FL=1